MHTEKLRKIKTIFIIQKRKEQVSRIKTLWKLESVLSTALSPSFKLLFIFKELTITLPPWQYYTVGKVRRIQNPENEQIFSIDDRQNYEAITTNDGW